MQCPDCDGDGFVSDVCPECAGNSDESGGNVCPDCGGDGYVETTCERCKGTGEIEED